MLIIWTAVIITAIVVLGYFWIKAANQPSKFDNFAQCLGEKGAIFYGAFWCPHCRNQKEMFGRAAKYLPYIECSTADGRGQLSVCKEQSADGYPTWVYSDGSRESGEISFERLAEKTGCELPPEK